jgi:hypothetical protein
MQTSSRGPLDAKLISLLLLVTLPPLLLEQQPLLCHPQRSESAACTVCLSQAGWDVAAGAVAGPHLDPAKLVLGYACPSYPAAV